MAGNDANEMTTIRVSKELRDRIAALKTQEYEPLHRVIQRMLDSYALGPPQEFYKAKAALPHEP